MFNNKTIVLDPLFYAFEVVVAKEACSAL